MASESYPQACPTMPAVAQILSRYDRPSLVSFISVAIDLLDVLDGDTDREDDDPDTSAEDNPQGFDPEEDRCLAGDDMVAAGPVIRSYYWRPGDDGDIGSNDDAEPKHLPSIMDDFQEAKA